MNSNERSSPVRSRTLEYRQAMKDFHIMFPSLEKDIIECVLRSNSGHVDSTIDQLLQLTQEGMSDSGRNIRSLERLYYTYDESTHANGRFPPELHPRVSSNHRHHPPKYTPTADFEPPPSPYTFSTQPVQPFSSRDQEQRLATAQKHYRDWNPPLLGTLPHDFLRIASTKRQDNPKKITSTHHHVHSSRPSQSMRAHHQSSSRQSLPGQAAGKSSPTFERSKHRPLERRKTTGEVNVVLGPTMRNERTSQQRMVMVENRKERKVSSHRHQSLRNTSSNSSPRRRNSEEQSQYVEDRKFALLLQNEEFLKELRRNEQFLQELNKGGNSRENNQVSAAASRNFQPISVDPLQQLPSTARHTNVASNEGHRDDSEDKDFNDSLKHMSKSAKKSFNEIAKKFYAKRKSYKSLGDTIDPVFANCEDDSRR